MERSNEEIYYGMVMKITIKNRGKLAEQVEIKSAL
jgi:hypothetical protein